MEQTQETFPIVPICPVRQVEFDGDASYLEQLEAHAQLRVELACGQPAPPACQPAVPTDSRTQRIPVYSVSPRTP
jgi:hypothetical protein